MTYQQYSYNFTGYTREQFRVGPNVFDILDEDDDGGADMDDIDIYFSFPEDSGAVEYNPVQLSKKLKDKGLNVVQGVRYCSFIPFKFLLFNSLKSKNF